MRHVILNFHGIGTPGRVLEDGETAYWVEPEFFAETVALAERLSDRIETRFTFDDGNASDIEIAAPVLSRAGRQAVIFPLADRIGAAGSLSGDDLKRLVKMGHSIGSHGAGHVDWSELDAAGETAEWEAAREVIAEAAGQPVTEAAIPFGRYNKRVLEGLKLLGYERCYSSDGGAWTEGDWPIPRTSPRADMTITDIEGILLGRESFKSRFRRKVSRAVKARR